MLPSDFIIMKLPSSDCFSSYQSVEYVKKKKNEMSNQGHSFACFMKLNGQVKGKILLGES